MKKFFGYTVLFSLCAVTVVLWVLSKNNLTQITELPYKSASQIASLLGITLMSITLVFSTKSALLEEIFGGLDKNYYLHHILGSLSFILIINHPLLLAAQVLPSFYTAQSYVFIGNDFAYNMGVLSLYTMILSFICMLFMKLSYEKWLLTHDLLGIAFVLAAIHILTISSDVSESLPLRIWMIFFICIGAAATIYKIILYQKLGKHYSYKITSISTQNDIINLLLSPTKKPMPFQPGQFLYMKCISRHIPPQLHPFSPSTTAEENEIRISAKMQGDYTKKMIHLQIGETALLYGPHGRFGEIYKKRPQKMVWIAGGIGVTPFLSLLHAEAIKPTNAQIHFFYASRTLEEQVFNSEIQTILPATPAVRFYPWPSEQKGRLNAEKIKYELEQVNEHLEDYYVLLCGPIQMMLSLQEQFLKLGLDEEQIIFEQFNFI